MNKFRNFPIQRKMLVMTLSIIFHLALSAAFRLYADTTLITSTATIFGPPFIGLAEKRCALTR